MGVRAAGAEPLIGREQARGYPEAGSGDASHRVGSPGLQLSCLPCMLLARVAAPLDTGPLPAPKDTPSSPHTRPSLPLWQLERGFSDFLTSGPRSRSPRHSLLDPTNIPKFGSLLAPPGWLKSPVWSQMSLNSNCGPATPDLGKSLTFPESLSAHLEKTGRIPVLLGLLRKLHYITHPQGSDAPGHTVGN